jgi:hypothetical protein
MYLTIISKVYFPITNNCYKQNTRHAEDKFSVCSSVAFLKVNRSMNETNILAQQNSKH